MRKARFLIIALLVLGAVQFLQSGHAADASVHVMRIWEVGGGAFGNDNIQWVELRMPSPSQNFTNGSVMCFYNSAGQARVRVAFTVNVGQGPDNASILIGTNEFDSAWAAGSPDFVIGGAGNTVTALNGEPDPNHPVQYPGGKVSFGAHDASCTPLAFPYDSLAYGVTGPAADSCCNNGGAGGRFTSDLPTTGTQGIILTGEFCHPSAFDGSTCTGGALRNNATNYSVGDVNTQTAYNPCKNGATPTCGTLSNPAITIAPGDDYYETLAGTQQSFAANPIPANFFDPGSEPFTGTVCLDGVPINQPTFGTADTILRRLQVGDMPQDVVPIELVQLSLVSCSPITVTYTGGIPAPQTWNVSAVLNPGQQSLGNMTIDQLNGSGGTFDSSFQVFPRFNFTRVSDSAPRGPLDYVPDTYTVTDSPWRFTCPSGILTGALNQTNNFCASVNDTMRVQTSMTATNASQNVTAACPDPDNDQVGTCVDNCPNNANPLQENNDGDALGDVCDPDDDNDTILDAAPDNCQFVANTNQANFDGDSMGDACDPDDDNDGNPDASDPDDDNDGVTDTAEANCGGTTPSSLRPERVDGIFFNADEDGDTQVDETITPNAFDCDGDGYTGNAENSIFSGPPQQTKRDQDPCGADGWPLELSSVTFPINSANRINAPDIQTYLSPRRLDTSPGDPNYSVRWDIVPGATFPFVKFINLADMSSLVFNLPPMFGGVTRAMNGPLCPWAP